MTHLRRIAAVVGAASLSVLLTRCADPNAITGAERAPAAPALETVSQAPTPVSCPNTTVKSASRIIGPRGGWVFVAGNGMFVPPGAVAEPTRFTLTLPVSQYFAVDISAENAEHYVFQRPVVVTLDYARCHNPALDDATLGVWWADATTFTLLQDMGGTNTRHLKQITFATPHLSTYIVATGFTSTQQDY